MSPDVQQKLDDLQRQIDDLKRQADTISPDINLADVFITFRRPLDESRGIFSVVSAVPSAAPQDAFDQIKVYVNAATYRLYWYDWSAKVWHYVTATA